MVWREVVGTPRSQDLEIRFLATITDVSVDPEGNIVVFLKIRNERMWKTVFNYFKAYRGYTKWFEVRWKFEQV